MTQQKECQGVRRLDFKLIEGFPGKGFPGGSAGKESACNAGDLGSIPGLGGSPLQYSGLENSMDCIVHGVAKSWHDLVTFTHLPGKGVVELRANWE